MLESFKKKTTIRLTYFGGPSEIFKQLPVWQPKKKHHSMYSKYLKKCVL